MEKRITFVFMKVIPQKIVQPVFHVVLWTFIFLYPFIFDYVNISDKTTLLRTFLLTSLQLILFYLNSLVLIPKFLAPKKIASYLAIVIVIITLVIGLSLGVQYFLNPDYNKNAWIFYHFLYNSVLLSLLIWGLSSGMKITAEWFKNERLKKEMENQKISAELLNLKSQINPHFLFNSLNSIYSLANKNADQKSAQAILKLSDMMRYMLYDSIDNEVPLEKEIEYLNNYIDLQRLRLRDNISVKFNVSGEVKDKIISPLLLIAFVENAFKHGISYQNESFISIELKVLKSGLSFRTSNSIFKEFIEREKSSGIGLENVKRRLELLYPQKHKLVIDKKDKSFDVELEMDLSND